MITTTTTPKTTTINPFWTNWSPTKPNEKLNELDADLLSIFNPNANNDLVIKDDWMNEVIDETKSSTSKPSANLIDESTRNVKITGNMDAWMTDFLQENGTPAKISNDNTNNNLSDDGKRYTQT